MGQDGRSEDRPPGSVPSAGRRERIVAELLDAGLAGSGTTAAAEVAAVEVVGAAAAWLAGSCPGTCLAAGVPEVAESRRPFAASALDPAVAGTRSFIFGCLYVNINIYNIFKGYCILTCLDSIANSLTLDK